MNNSGIRVELLDRLGLCWTLHCNWVIAAVLAGLDLPEEARVTCEICSTPLPRFSMCLTASHVLLGAIMTVKGAM